MATNDKFRLTARATYLGQQIQNVYHFIQTAGTGGAQPLAQEFRLSWLIDIALVQNVGVSNFNALVVNLDDDEDFADFTYSSAELGKVTGEGLPSYVCWTYRVTRTSRLFRNGFKRFVGVSESSIVGNNAAAAFEAALATLGTALSTDIDDGSNTWAIIIPRYTGTPPVLNNWDIAGNVNYSHVGSQVSRKVGRGT